MWICKIEADVEKTGVQYLNGSILFQLAEIEIEIYIYYRLQSGLLVIQVTYMKRLATSLLVRSIRF